MKTRAFKLQKGWKAPKTSHKRTWLMQLICYISSLLKSCDRDLNICLDLWEKSPFVLQKVFIFSVTTQMKVLFVEIWRAALTHLHLLISIFGGVLAALTLPAQFLQLGLALLQTLSFTFVFHLIFLQSCLPDEITQLSSQSTPNNIQMDKMSNLMVVFQKIWPSIYSRKSSSG